MFLYNENDKSFTYIIIDLVFYDEFGNLLKTEKIYVNTLIENLPMLIQAALILIQALANGLLAALPELMAALPEIIFTITDFR